MMPEQRFFPFHGKMVNVFLVPLEKSFLLVDTPSSREQKSFAQFLDEKLDAKRPGISHVLLTHHHSDHVGLVGWMRERFPGLVLIAHDKEWPLLRGGKNHVGHTLNRRVAFLSRLISLNPRFAPVVPGENDIVLSGREATMDLNPLGFPGSIFFTPGHTRGSVSLLVENRDLLAGDLFMNWPLNFVGTNPFPFLVQDFTDLLNSYRILERTGVQRVFPAHGKPFSFARVKQSLPRLEALAGKRSTGMA